MESLKAFMQCGMLIASSADSFQALRLMKPKTAKFFIKGYWIAAAATLGVMIFG